jgi:hypothetical protein
MSDVSAEEIRVPAPKRPCATARTEREAGTPVFVGLILMMGAPLAAYAGISAILPLFRALFPGLPG